MQERNGAVISGLVLLLLAFPLGYLLHVSPRFPGSLLGSLIGILGATLMLAPLLYLAVKRIPVLKMSVTRHVSMRTLLAIHIYAGVLGPILGVIHTGHKFASPLGLSLTGMMVVVVLSGYVGRYLLAQISTAIHGRQSELAALSAAFQRVSSEAATNRNNKRPAARFQFRWVSLLFNPTSGMGDSAARSMNEAIRLADAMADVEFAVRAEEVVRGLFEKWLRLHILIAMVLYLLLFLHVWSGLYFGLRWL